MAVVVALSDGNWNTAGTWNTNSVPTIGDTVYANNKIITIDADVILNNAATVNAGSFIVGQWYVITTAGTTTTWTSIGAANGNVGTYFIATGAGSGNGVARPIGTLTTGLSSTGATYPAAGGRFQLTGSLASNRLIYADLRAGTTPCLSAALTTGTYVLSSANIIGGSSNGAYGIINTVSSSFSAFNLFSATNLNALAGSVLGNSQSLFNNSTGNVTIASAFINGGGVVNTSTNTGNLTFLNCNIDNSSSNSSAIAVINSSSVGKIYINNCTIPGPGNAVDGGICFLNNGNGDLFINNSTLTSGERNASGLTNNGFCTATINNSILQGGGGSWGGGNNGAGLVINAGTCIFNSCIINGSSQSRNGCNIGGATISVFTNCTFAGGSNGIGLNIISNAANVICTTCIAQDGTGSASYGISNAGSNFTFSGNLLSMGISNAYFSTSTSSNARFSGNILNAANGTAVIYAPSYRIDPVPSNSYIRYARNGTGVGSDAYTTLYTADTFTSFSTPPVSAVRAGIVFANGTLTGTSQIPSASAVAFGTRYDTNGSTVGLAFNNANVIFNTPISAINIPNSIGDRLKKSATVEATGHLIASFSN